MSCRLLSFSDFQYNIFWKKSVLSLENESDDCPKRRSSERSIFNHSVIKVTPICFKFKDDIMQLMCKFEANRCDFYDTMIENRPFGALSFWAVIAFVFQTQHRFFPKNIILEVRKR